MEPPSLGVRRIARIVLVVSDVARLADFYRGALGFATVAETSEGAVLQLGAQQIELTLAAAGAPPYPQPSAANDPWFQHFAIRVADMAAAYTRLRRYPHAPISVGGPQRLPPSTGSVTAYKFRDPDGHPLELSYSPEQHGDGRAGELFAGVDHTALAVRDLEASIGFYTHKLGFRLAGRFLNQGPEQDRLDGLPGVELDIVALRSLDPGPHIELLHYRRPASAVVPRIADRGAILATRTVLEAPDPPGPELDLAHAPHDRPGGDPIFTDPDGHLLEIRRPAADRA